MSNSTQEKELSFRHLLDSYLEGNLDEKNINILFNYIRDHQSDSTRLVLQAGLKNYQKKLQDENNIDPEQSRRIRERLMKETGTVPVVQMYRPGRRKIYAAAAIVIGLLAGASYFLIKMADTAPGTVAQQPAEQRFKNDIAPGENKAVLTLADGTAILLDSMKKGTLALESGARIIKLDDGELMYDFKDVRQEKTAGTGYNTISTPRGGQYQIQLSDGTRVWLNAASSLRFPTAFTGNTREVQLNGEAYMEVSADKSRPFEVKVRNMHLQVLGTHFNIMGYDDETNITTTLLNGSVQVSSTGGVAEILSPGEHALLDSKGAIHVEKADVEEEVAWKNGLIQYNGDNIQKIMRQVARWYNVDVVYEGNMANKDFACAVSRNANVSQLLKMLELTGAVHFSIEDKKIIVQP